MPRSTPSAARARGPSVIKATSPSVKRLSKLPETYHMTENLFLLIGTFALMCGTALQVAAWFRENDTNTAAVTMKHVATWAFDPVLLKNDDPADHPGVLQARAYRRMRAGWVWLFIGAFLSFLGTLLGLL